MDSIGWTVFNWLWKHVLPWIIIMIAGLIVLGILIIVAFVVKQVFVV